LISPRFVIIQSTIRNPGGTRGNDRPFQKKRGPGLQKHICLGRWKTTVKQVGPLQSHFRREKRGGKFQRGLNVAYNQREEGFQKGVQNEAGVVDFPKESTEGGGGVDRLGLGDKRADLRFYS